MSYSSSIRTDIEKEYRKRLKAEASKKSYEHYVEYVHICQKLNEIELGIIKRLMIFLPPRHRKSMTVSDIPVLFY